MTHIAPPPDAEFLSDLADVGVDVQKRDLEGCWVGRTAVNQFLPAGIEVLVIGFMSPAIKALQATLSEGRPPNYATDAAVAEQRNNYENRTIAAAGLKGWRAQTKDGRCLPVIPIEGRATPFSREAARATIDDPRFWKFGRGVLNAMSDADDARLTYEKQAEKNSEAGSPGA
jgi:hypothetical protein